TGDVEGLHAAGRAEEMLGGVRVEGICRERFAPAHQVESIGRYDQVQIPAFFAHGAVAVRDLELGRCGYFEADSAAVTAAGVCRHVVLNASTRCAARTRLSSVSACAPAPPD